MVEKELTNLKNAKRGRRSIFGSQADQLKSF